VPELDSQLLLILSGGLIGLIMGGAARLVRFCTFGAIEDVVLASSTVRLRTWFLAMAVAIGTTQVSVFAGYTDLNSSPYLEPSVAWVGALVGGLLFGFGMALAGNCGYGSIIRMASGDLRALVIMLCLGISAYITARGVLNPVRTFLLSPTEVELTTSQNASIPGAIHSAVGLHPGIAVGLICTALLYWCFASRTFRHSTRDIIVAVVVGLCVTAAFVVTSFLSQHAFDSVQVEGLSYALPPGETLIYAMTFTGAKMDFAVATIIGTIAGALGIAFVKNEFHLDGFDDVRDMRRQLMGACMMGIGGVAAGGCTVGQGLSGMATLSINSPLAVLGIILGGALGIQYLIGGRFSDILTSIAALDLRGNK
jgi:uncharacterized protein